jgi:hypothetical protein
LLDHQSHQGNGSWIGFDEYGQERANMLGKRVQPRGRVHIWASPDQRIQADMEVNTQSGQRSYVGHLALLDASVAARGDSNRLRHLRLRQVALFAGFTAHGTDSHGEL